MKYWINTVSRSHVLDGVKGGFTQADHGKNNRLKRLEKGDLLIFYSPRTDYKSGKPLQAFTAIGCIADETPYQVKMSPEFHPWRRKVEFFESKEVSVRDLIEKLNFIKNKKHWGYAFRSGLFEVGQADFELIAKTTAPDISNIISSPKF